MRRNLIPTVMRFAVALIVAAGLAGAGLAHRTQAPVDPQFAAFIEIGGTLSDICDDGSPITHWGDTGCEACRLIQALDPEGPGAVPALTGPDLAFHFALPVGQVPVLAPPLRHTAARAPPVVG